MVGTGFLGLFFLGFSLGDRGVMKPTRLNLKRSFNRSHKVSKYSHQGATMSKEARFEGAKAQAEFSGAKNLNIMFMYNGHDWDAYQVLGVPAGSKYEAVRKAYLMALDSADPASHDFLQAALTAIESDHKRSA